MKQTTSPVNNAASLRRLMRAAREATLATLAHDHSQIDDGWPVASMVQPVIDIDGAPVLLISELADHTRHIHNDPRVSLMFRPLSCASKLAASDEKDDNLPVTNTQRLTIFGRAHRHEDERLKRRYLTLQPDAGLYAGFADFAFYRVEIEAAYWVGGFGKQRRLRGDQLVLTQTQDLAHHHDTLVQNLNTDQHELINQIVQTHSPENNDSAPGWKVMTIDCDGMNLTCNDTVLRIEFPHTISSKIEGQKILVKMGQKQS